jgi:hypothetical protein
LRNVPWNIRLLVSKLHVVNTPPEIAKSISTAIWTVESREHCVGWLVSEANNRGVETNINIALMAPGLKHECISAVAPLTVVALTTHLMPHFINPTLTV